MFKRSEPSGAHTPTGRSFGSLSLPPTHITSMLFRVLHSFGMGPMMLFLYSSLRREIRAVKWRRLTKVFSSRRHNIKYITSPPMPPLHMESTSSHQLRRSQGLSIVVMRSESSSGAHSVRGGSSNFSMPPTHMCFTSVMVLHSFGIDPVILLVSKYLRREMSTLSVVMRV
jgi:hypothetical protein